MYNEKLRNLCVERECTVGLHVARIVWMRSAYKILSGKPERKDCLLDQEVDGRIISLFNYVLKGVRMCGWVTGDCSFQ